jgi:hypothetical protein
VLLADAVSAQTFRAGKRISGRAVEPVSSFCTGAGLTGKTFCNDKDKCVAVGLYVSDRNF